MIRDSAKDPVKKLPSCEATEFFKNICVQIWTTSLQTRQPQNVINCFLSQLSRHPLPKIFIKNHRQTLSNPAHRQTNGGKRIAFLAEVTALAMQSRRQHTLTQQSKCTSSTALLHVNATTISSNAFCPAPMSDVSLWGWRVEKRCSICQNGGLGQCCHSYFSKFNVKICVFYCISAR